MNFGEAVLFGILQGIFEWLPVSSEAIIVLAMQYLSGTGVEPAVETAIWLHVGTMLAALFYFREKFTDIGRIILSAVKERSMPAEQDYRLILFLTIATGITGVIGGVLYVIGIQSIAQYPDLFAGLMAAALFLTGVLRLYSPSARRDIGSVNLVDGILTGGLQSLSVIPGISRSGITVFGLLYRDFSAEDAFVLSFLLSVPTILIANIGVNLLSGFTITGPLLVAAATAAVIGYMAIDAVLKIADRTGIAYICFLLAALSLLPVLL